MDVLSEIVRHVILIIFLTTFLEMIMPSSSMQRFVKVVMGLFILIAILNPLLNLLVEQRELDAFVWQQEELLQPQSDRILENSAHFQKLNNDLVWGEYKRKIERHMESIVQTVQGVKEVQVNVKLAETVDGTTQYLEEVYVAVDNKDTQLSEEEIVKRLSQYYGLNERQIKIVGGEKDE